MRKRQLQPSHDIFFKYSLKQMALITAINGDARLTKQEKKELRDHLAAKIKRNI
jgi:hypothetical protein